MKGILADPHDGRVPVFARIYVFVCVCNSVTPRPPDQKNYNTVQRPQILYTHYTLLDHVLFFLK